MEGVATVNVLPDMGNHYDLSMLPNYERLALEYIAHALNKDFICITYYNHYNYRVLNLRAYPSRSLFTSHDLVPYS